MTTKTVWSHETATCDGMSLAQVAVPSTTGRVLTAGGFASLAEGHESSEDTTGKDADGSTRVIGTVPVVQPDGSTVLKVLFEGPKDTAIRAHVWAFVEETTS